MIKSCPITNIKVNETAVRIQAAFISVLGLVFILHAHYIWLFILLYDFSIRIAGHQNFSPLAIASRLIVKILSLKPHMVDAGAKKFAAKVGLIFVIIAIALFFLGMTQLSFYVVGILIICALLEAIIGYCVGCKFYQIWQTILYKYSK